ncbi:hypothetical protein MNV49_000062 [Pseudohyphozyma bogoriensis]|nr:hypothetical protein MNV49_000062 [Pseudohyphozyma bogoriensis]
MAAALKPWLRTRACLNYQANYGANIGQLISLQKNCGPLQLVKILASGVNRSDWWLEMADGDSRVIVCIKSETIHEYNAKRPPTSSFDKQLYQIFSIQSYVWQYKSPRDSSSSDLLPKQLCLEVLTFDSFADGPRSKLDKPFLCDCRDSAVRDWFADVEDKYGDGRDKNSWSRGGGASAQKRASSERGERENSRGKSEEKPSSRRQSDDGGGNGKGKERERDDDDRRPYTSNAGLNGPTELATEKVVKVVWSIDSRTSDKGGLSNGDVKQSSQMIKNRRQLKFVCTEEDEDPFLREESDGEDESEDEDVAIKAEDESAYHSQEEREESDDEARRLAFEAEEEHQRRAQSKEVSSAAQVTKVAWVSSPAHVTKVAWGSSPAQVTKVAWGRQALDDDDSWGNEGEAVDAAHVGSDSPTPSRIKSDPDDSLPLSLSFPIPGGRHAPQMDDESFVSAAAGANTTVTSEESVSQDTLPELSQWAGEPQARQMPRDANDARSGGEKASDAFANGVMARERRAVEVPRFGMSSDVEEDGDEADMEESGSSAERWVMAPTQIHVESQEGVSMEAAGTAEEEEKEEEGSEDDEDIILRVDVSRTQAGFEGPRISSSRESSSSITTDSPHTVLRTGASTAPTTTESQPRAEKEEDALVPLADADDSEAPSSPLKESHSQRARSQSRSQSKSQSQSDSQGKGKENVARTISSSTVDDEAEASEGATSQPKAGAGLASTTWDDFLNGNCSQVEDIDIGDLLYDETFAPLPQPQPPVTSYPPVVLRRDETLVAPVPPPQAPTTSNGPAAIVAPAVILPTPLISIEAPSQPLFTDEEEQKSTLTVEVEFPAAKQAPVQRITTPSITTPSITTPSVPTPSVPTPSVPTYSVTTPSVTAPSDVSFLLPSDVSRALVPDKVTIEHLSSPSRKEETSRPTLKRSIEDDAPSKPRVKHPRIVFPSFENFAHECRRAAMEKRDFDARNVK